MTVGRAAGMLMLGAYSQAKIADELPGLNARNDCCPLLLIFIRADLTSSQQGLKLRKPLSSGSLTSLP